MKVGDSVRFRHTYATVVAGQSVVVCKGEIGRIAYAGKVAVKVEVKADFKMRPDSSPVQDIAILKVKRGILEDVPSVAELP